MTRRPAAEASVYVTINDASAIQVRDAETSRNLCHIVMGETGTIFLSAEAEDRLRQLLNERAEAVSLPSAKIHRMPQGRARK